MFEVYKRAVDLPEIWDDAAAENIFLRREILQKLEETNPCSQAYHLNPKKKIALVSYKLKLNLLTFTKHFTVTCLTNIIGIPMSVAKSGYSPCDQNNRDALSEYIQSLKGLYLVLNADDQLDFAQGRTLPTCKLDLQWESFDHYLASMRTHYRYRLKKAIERFNDVKVEKLEDNRLFDQTMYKLYLQVYERSNEKLEKLKLEFFQEFPATILKFTLHGETIGFVQLVENGDEIFFLFGGFEHRLNQTYDLYINMLLHIIDFGLENGAKHIDFGQTTETTKLKLGAVQIPKFIYMHHSNPILNTLLGKLVGQFSYRPYGLVHKVFKEFEGDRD